MGKKRGITLQERRFKKVGTLTLDDANMLGIKKGIAYKKFVFVDPSDRKDVRVLAELVKTGDYEPITWYCEGEKDYFKFGWGIANRFAYSVAKSRKNQEVK